MEMGIGFLVGIMAGAVVSLITAVIVAISRKAVAKNAKARALDPGAPPVVTVQKAAELPAKMTDPAQRRGQTAVRNGSVNDSTRTSSGNTMIIGKVNSPEIQLNKSVKEVRELLLHLADVISATENASGEATLAFNSARDAIDKMDSDSSPELSEAQKILVNEIDRVLQSNIKLHSELDKANNGIAEQRRQIEELRVQARIDVLTKIPNRASFDERLGEYIGLLERTQIGFCLLMVDIDHFKQVNDSYGHINGDRILRGVAARINSSVRTNDFAARYGGEEFAVIFPATDLTESVAVAERIRQDIAKTNFRLDDKIIKMTISGGIAQCLPHMSGEDVIAAADQALYKAKNSGRNRIGVNNQQSESIHSR